ncbi:unnamed protein product, partial [Scytosiphon promiscuus]
QRRFGLTPKRSGSPPRAPPALSPGSPMRASSLAGSAPAAAPAATPTTIAVLDSPKQRRRQQQQQHRQHLPSPLGMVGSDWSGTSPRAAAGPLTAEVSPPRSTRRRASLSPGPTGMWAEGRSPSSRSFHFPDARSNE